MHDELKSQALSTIHQAMSPHGFYATSIDTDNYRRVWARDSVMTGIAACLAQDSEGIEGFRRSLVTLAEHQHSTGFIPSNVGDTSTSYGSLVGRIDATLWYAIGVMIYSKAANDSSIIENHRSSVLECFALMDAWEFNGRHLLYTPLSGNWADEYPIHGYTLYDNCLRLWALELWQDQLPELTAEKVNQVRTAISGNFWVDATTDRRYHDRLYKDTVQSETSQYLEAGFNPSLYYRLFDAAGNGIALLLGLLSTQQSQQIADYLEQLCRDIGQDYAPAFWPVIHPGDDLHQELVQNYAYSFKNRPHHFHNGGIWPIMQGWLSMGLRMAGHAHLADRYTQSYATFAKKEGYEFSEYIDSEHWQPGGNKHMCYSASGALMMMTDAKTIIDTLAFK